MTPSLQTEPIFIDRQYMDTISTDRHHCSLSVFPAHANKLMREQVLTRLGSAGDEDIKAEAFRRFEDHCSGTRVLAGDIRTPVSLSCEMIWQQGVIYIVSNKDKCQEWSNPWIYSPIQLWILQNHRFYFLRQFSHYSFYNLLFRGTKTGISIFSESTEISGLCLFPRLSGWPLLWVHGHWIAFFQGSVVDRCCGSMVIGLPFSKAQWLTAAVGPWSLDCPFPRLSGWPLLWVHGHWIAFFQGSVVDRCCGSMVIGFLMTGFFFMQASNLGSQFLILCTCVYWNCTVVVSNI